VPHPKKIYQSLELLELFNITICYYCLIRGQTCFTLPGGSIVQNIIARGPDQTLHLTFTYEWHLSGIEPGTNEAKKAEDDHMKIAVSSVQGTIKAMGKMAQENRI
jgi:hypothetical protein